ncbi:Transposase DDE domain-containing protein [Atopostipes suicloacalis DSM 15692]|uniref:Transposase DDE domain-containing protein n=1 Tax=Atopostipes suicloacalis DSM 15692 TaxID=1121025 RepID=A0A1M4YE87_9LACT|nr:transposase [Atopostipes suicloacalis]SHE94218.1 Transposase DDE domain-containing protein [Atopostipes suicloacalis DSM 15692]SHE96132.1 Transposase DDE domain-containing protein [Atopostipes suicloacalis DSM 15692]SHF04144.1 Transposase DDE domain-containing protein [Atopostipes suicloacalis DSM 15692]
MFKENNSQQMNIMDDSYLQASKRVQKIVEKSWAKPFAEIIFPAINEARFSVLYSDDNGRPNTPINYIFSSLLLKETLGLTDDELTESLHCDVRFQYALHSTSMKEQPVSDRTFSRFRANCYAYQLETGRDLIEEEILALSKEIAEYFDLSPTQKRMDSMMIASNTRKLSRLELLYTCIEKLIHSLDTSYPSLDITAFKHYLNTDQENQFIYHDDTPYNEKLHNLIKDAYTLIDTYSDELSEHPDFQLLCRAVDDQTTKNEKGESAVKKGKEIRPNSLQTPYDPDATYRYKAGKGYIGYSANIVETVGTDLSLITDYDYDINSQSDVNFGYSAIEQMGKQELSTTLIADGAYNSDDNQALAEANNVQLITTQLKGKKPNIHYADIILDEDSKTIVQCPGGLRPLSTSYYPETDTYRAVFDLKSAENCCCSICSKKKQKKTTVLIVTPKAVQRAKQAKEMKEVSFLQYSHFRNGIEGIPSILRRKYSVDRMPFRGLVRSKQCFGFKIGGINVKNAVKAYQNRAIAV